MGLSESSCCYLCGHQGKVLFADVADYLCGVPGRWSIMSCPRPGCGLLWVYPEPSAERLPELYRQYYTHGIGSARPSATMRLYEHAREGVLATSFGYRQATRSVFWRMLGHTLGYVPFVKDA